MNRNAYIHVERDLLEDRVQFVVTSQGEDQNIRRHDDKESAMQDARSRLLGKGEIVDWSA